MLTIMKNYIINVLYFDLQSKNVLGQQMVPTMLLVQVGDRIELAVTISKNSNDDLLRRLDCRANSNHIYKLNKM